MSRTEELAKLETKTLPLFVYGSLCPGGSNEHELTQVGDGSFQKATLRGRLMEAGWGAGLGYPGLIPDETSPEINGYIFASPNLLAHWARLDEFEGDEYERVQVTVRAEDGHPVDVYVYAVAPKYRLAAPPSPGPGVAPLFHDTQHAPPSSAAADPLGPEPGPVQ